MKVICEIDSECDFKLSIYDNDGNIVPRDTDNVDEIGEATSLAAIMLGEIVNAVSEYSSSDYKMRHAAVMTLSLALENCSSILTGKLKGTLEEIVDHLKKSKTTVKIAIDKNALREALKKEREEKEQEE